MKSRAREHAQRVKYAKADTSMLLMLSLRVALRVAMRVALRAGLGAAPVAELRGCSAIEWRALQSESLASTSSTQEPVRSLEQESVRS